MEGRRPNIREGSAAREALEAAATQNIKAARDSVFIAVGGSHRGESTATAVVVDGCIRENGASFLE